MPCPSTRTVLVTKINAATERHNSLATLSSIYLKQEEKAGVCDLGKQSRKAKFWESLLGNCSTSPIGANDLLTLLHRELLFVTPQTPTNAPLSAEIVSRPEQEAPSDYVFDLHVEGHLEWAVSAKKRGSHQMPLHLADHLFFATGNWTRWIK